VGGITPAELVAVRGRLETFAEDIFASLPRKDQRARGECYLRGLMLDGRRKSQAPEGREGEKREPAGQEEGDRGDSNPRPSGPQPDALTN
jgi:hypothetical protein